MPKTACSYFDAASLWPVNRDIIHKHIRFLFLVLSTVHIPVSSVRLCFTPFLPCLCPPPVACCSSGAHTLTAHSGRRLTLRDLCSMKLLAVPIASPPQFHLLLPAQEYLLGCACIHKQPVLRRGGQGNCTF